MIPRLIKTYDYVRDSYDILDIIYKDSEKAAFDIIPLEMRDTVIMTGTLGYTNLVKVSKLKSFDTDAHAKCGLEIQMPFKKVKVHLLQQLDDQKLDVGMPKTYYPCSSGIYHVFMAGELILTYKPDLDKLLKLV